MGSGYVGNRHSRPIALLNEAHFLFNREPPAPLDAGNYLDTFLRHSNIHRRTPMPYQLCHVSGRKRGRSSCELIEWTLQDESRTTKHSAEVLSKCDNLLAQKPKGELIWLLRDRALLQLAAGHVSEAMAGLRDITRRKSREAWAWADLGSAYVSAKNMQPAIGCYARAIDLSRVEKFSVGYRKQLALLLITSGRSSWALTELLGLRITYTKNGWAGKKYADIERLITEVSADGCEPLTEPEARRQLADATMLAELALYERIDVVFGNLVETSVNGRGHVCVKLDDRVVSIYCAFLKPAIRDLQPGHPLTVHIGRINEGYSVLDASIRIEGARWDIVEKWDPSKQSREGDVSSMEGLLRVNPAGFGFVHDVYVPKNFAAGFLDGDSLKLVATMRIDPKKNRLSWCAVFAEKNL